MRSPRILLLTALLAAPALAQSDTPQALQRTQDLNRAEAEKAAQYNQQYEQQKEEYREQQRRYEAQKQHYESQAARYLAARDRYAAERARYRHGEWPSRYERLTFVETAELMGAPVETSSGAPAGRVVDVARVNGRIDAVRVALDDGASHVWIDRGDLKFDTEDRLLITIFAKHDLYSMSREQY